MSTSSNQPKLHALIIGVNYYIRQAGAGDNSLWGCVGDATRLRDHIQRYLDAQGSPGSGGSITLLTSTAKDDRGNYYYPNGKQFAFVQGPRETENLPTYANIVTELLKLHDKAQKGDTVIFAYSGHGGRWDTKVPGWEEKTAQTAFDEFLCPYDINKKGLGVRDWELNWLLGRIANKGVKLTVFLDCCHSGGATREAGPPPPVSDATREAASSQLKEQPEPLLPVARVLTARSDAGTDAEKFGVSSGSRTVDIQEYYKAAQSPLLEHIAEIRKAWSDLMSASNINSRTAGAMSTTPRLLPMNYTCYTGCLAHELSWESGNSGALTGATVSALKMLEKLPPTIVCSVSMRNMYRYILDVVYRVRYERDRDRRIVNRLFQTPLLLGPNDGQFPGVITQGAEFVHVNPEQEEFARGVVPLHVRWEIDPASEERFRPVESPPGLFLRAGKAHGVQVGSVYGVWLWYENPDSGSVPSVRVVVTDVRKVVSVVQPVVGTELPESWKTLFDLERQFRVLSRDNGDLYPWPSGCVARLLSRPIPTSPPDHTTDKAMWSCLVRIVGQVEGLDEGDYSPGVLPVTFTTSEDSQPDFRIAANSSTPNMYELKAGTDGTQLIPPTTLAKCVEAARHIAQYNALLMLDDDGENPLRNSFRLAFNSSPPERKEGYTYVTFEWLPKTEDNTTYTPHANVSIFHFSGAPHYSVRKIYPQDGGFESLDDGKQQKYDSMLRRNVTTYEGSKREIGFKGTGGVVKAVVTFTSTVFDSWELGPLDGIAVGSEVNKKRLSDIKNETVAPGGGPVEIGPDEDELEARFNHWCTLKL